MRKVALTMHTLGPASVRTISNTAGVSYNTVKNALGPLKALPIEDRWPTEWMLDMTEVDDTLFQPAPPKLSKSATTTTVDIVTVDNWVERWESTRSRFGSTIGRIKLEPDNDPSQLAEDFAKGASTLASLAHALRQVEDKPEWFELLGGNLEPTQVN